MAENKNEVVVVDTMYVAPKSEVKAYRNNYNLTIGENKYELIRDVDFGKIPNAKTPSLFKSGAEKVLLGYGLYYDVILTDSYKDHESGYFYFEHTARAYDQQGRIVRVGVGCANTKEKSNGFATGFDTANSAMKKSKKRAVVDLALTLGGLSDAFTQDIEDDNNEKRASNLQKDDDPINAKQVKRIFAIASNNEITVEKAKELLQSWGYTSTKDIKVKDYDSVCEKLEKYNKEENE
jgi:hypothetical protein